MSLCHARGCPNLKILPKQPMNFSYVFPDLRGRSGESFSPQLINDALWANQTFFLILSFACNIIPREKNIQFYKLNSEKVGTLNKV